MGQDLESHSFIRQWLIHGDICCHPQMSSQAVCQRGLIKILLSSSFSLYRQSRDPKEIPKHIDWKCRFISNEISIQLSLLTCKYKNKALQILRGNFLSACSQYIVFTFLVGNWHMHIQIASEFSFHPCFHPLSSSSLYRLIPFLFGKKNLCLYFL